MVAGHYRQAVRSMKAPFHMRGPCMAKLWLLFALAIIGVQMVFVVNLLLKKRAAGDTELEVEKPGADLAAGDSAKLQWNSQASEDAEKDPYRENSLDSAPEQVPLIPPALEVKAFSADKAAQNFIPQTVNKGPTTVSPLEDNNPMFNFLRSAVEQAFDGNPSSAGGSAAGIAQGSPLSQINSLIPLMALLPAMTGGGQSSGNPLGAVNWEKFMPMLERVERFAKYAASTFQQTVQETKQKHPQKAKEPSFISAVAMKGFFRIFSNEDYQEEFLDIADDSFALMESLHVTDHVIDLVSGRMFEKVMNSPDGVPADGNFLSGGAAGLAAIFLKSEKEKTTTTTTTTKNPNKDPNEEEEEEDLEEDEEGKAALVSNEHFESIMEVYDFMFRDEENNNATAAKLEVAGRTFLQGWYGAMRRFAIEKGKLHAKPLTDPTFDKYLESVEVPFSNILDYGYPIKNEDACKTKSPTLLIMVLSKTQHTGLRNAIRQTWAAPSAAPKSSFKALFILTDRDEDRNLVAQEATKYGDIISVDVPQTYEYVTRKVLVALDWPVTYCPGAKYVFKTTDHVYVNVSHLQEEIDARQTAQLMGNLVADDAVQRIPLRLDHLFYDEYPFDKFKPYLKGYGLLMGMNFVKGAIGIAKDFPLLRTDDFAVTGMLSAKLKIPPVGFKRAGAVADLNDAPWEDTQKMVALICEQKKSVLFGSKLTAPKFLLGTAVTSFQIKHAGVTKNSTKLKMSTSSKGRHDNGFHHVGLVHDIFLHWQRVNGSAGEEFVVSAASLS
ncbi:putative UDP-GalNAc:beta-1,3-N-acetylgalactosaminyltransferase 1 [Hypsibius exemplaris]|uniref:UDP-GalNAc:beta-1,3-N-acetylgalactosaminyltransferase 1 n=1 Tax=Hypsibius exemplaris TaxID=2072580 RepID=A0A1W0WAE6_HYPEX|nr:putative UDP-GalNAc:beta-1,3-N-acetylgalactosaminyltransferase 1 [Hypsibius exemplaris]